jgi:hypothetical protein
MRAYGTRLTEAENAKIVTYLKDRETQPGID